MVVEEVDGAERSKEAGDGGGAQGSKEGARKGGKEGSKEGGKEGSKEGGKEGGKGADGPEEDRLTQAGARAPVLANTSETNPLEECLLLTCTEVFGSASVDAIHKVVSSGTALVAVGSANQQ